MAAEIAVKKALKDTFFMHLFEADQDLPLSFHHLTVQDLLDKRDKVTNGLKLLELIPRTVSVLEKRTTKSPPLTKTNLQIIQDYLKMRKFKVQ